MLSRKSKLLALMLSVAFFAVLNHAIDSSAGVLPRALQLIAYVSLPVAGGLITLSFCSLLGAFADSENSTGSHLLKKVSEAPIRNFFAGFLLAAYLSYIRPPLAAHVPLLQYGEWVAIVLVVYLMFSMTRLASEAFYVPSGGLSWKMHIQEVTRVAGRDLIRITSVMKQFVDYGAKEPLIVFLSLHLQRLGKTENDILKRLSPLIDYQDERKPRLYFLVYPWGKRKLVEKNKKAREDLLDTLLDKIDRMQSE